MTDSYREHIERRRAERSDEQRERLAIRNGLLSAAKEAGVGDIPADKIEPLVSYVLDTKDLALGQVLVLGVFLLASASTAMREMAAAAIESDDN